MNSIFPWQNNLRTLDCKGEFVMWFRGIVLSIWDLIDPVYYALTRLRKVNCPAKESIFRVRLTSYRGRSIRLADGTHIRKNDILLKIHLHNVMLLKEMLPLMSDVKKGRYLYHSIERSLPDIAEYVKNHPKSDQIKGIIGITMLNRGGGHLGFETVPIVSMLYRLYKWTCLMPIYLLSATEPVRKFKKYTPAYQMMSKETLFQKYGAVTKP